MIRIEIQCWAIKLRRTTTAIMSAVKANSYLRDGENAISALAALSC